MCLHSHFLIRHKRTNQVQGVLDETCMGSVSIKQFSGKVEGMPGQLNREGKNLKSWEGGRQVPWEDTCREGASSEGQEVIRPCLGGMKDARGCCWTPCSVFLWQPSRKDRERFCQVGPAQEGWNAPEFWRPVRTGLRPSPAVKVRPRWEGGREVGSAAPELPV